MVSKMYFLSARTPNFEYKYAIAEIVKVSLNRMLK